MNDEPAPLDELASAVSDGKPINWDAEASQVSDDLAQDIRQLRIIAGIADLHRQIVGPSQAETVEASIAQRVLTYAPTAPVDGPRFGPLVIKSKLGSGAFGDVFHAWDTTLDREVALKVLRARARGSKADTIVREGQMLARVSHRNVMAIYGAQEVDGQVGIWGEFLHGRTLARMVGEDGPLSADEALVAGDAIARALAAAHKAGVLHRDVKAQNVIREKGGRIVLMDFGLGRDLDRGPEEPGPATTGKELAGTPLYLAPELFDGGHASPQSDIYSLGVLLFFLVTGAFPVKAASLEGIGDAHRRRDRKRLQDLRPELPTRFVQVVERALEPDPAKRFESAGAMQAALVSATQTVTDGAVTRVGVPPMVAVVAALALVLAAAGVTAWVLTRPGPDLGFSAFRIEPPPGTKFPDSSRNSPTISPDGRFLALAVTGADGLIHLWLHDLSTGEARMIVDSGGAQTPFWSPDSQSVAFFEPGGTLRTVGIAPGSKPAGTRATAGEPRGGAWNAQGVLLLSKGTHSGLWQVPAIADSGGAGEIEVVKRDTTRGEIGLMWPQFLRDGNRFIYFIFSDDPAVRGIYLGSLDNRMRKFLARSDTSAVVNGDKIAFVQGGNLMALTVDWSSGTPVGTPTMMIKDVAATYDFQTVASFADDGTMVYLPAAESSELAWFDRAGKRLETLSLLPGRFRSPAISRDGNLLAVQRFRDTISAIEIYELPSLRQLPAITQSVAVEASVWGSGHNLIYTSIEHGRSEIFIRDFDSDRPSQSVFFNPPDNEADVLPMDWHERSRVVTFLNLTGELGYKIWTAPIDASRKAAPWNAGEGIEVGARLSPDGSRIIYARKPPMAQTGVSSERVLWISNFPVPGNQFRVATGGTDPAWPSNSEVSFFDRNDRFTIVDAKPTSAAEAIEKAGFPTDVRTPAASRNNYAWDPGGQRVLMNVPVTRPEAVRIVVTVPRRPPGR
ncbi:MAG TPA: protein kinase [Vicinamibacterales bacterium]|nr:protein kinase [Vicinamibacterales bacterium]